MATAAPESSPAQSGTRGRRFGRWPRASKASATRTPMNTWSKVTTGRAGRAGVARHAAAESASAQGMAKAAAMAIRASAQTGRRGLPARRLSTLTKATVARPLNTAPGRNAGIRAPSLAGASRYADQSEACPDFAPATPGGFPCVGARAKWEACSAAFISGAIGIGWSGACGCRARSARRGCPAPCLSPSRHIGRLLRRRR